MEFKKFSSLENTYRQNLIDKVYNEGFDKQPWIVTEKLHGANFSFWCDGNKVRVASRSQFVDGTFYNCQSVIDKYSEKVMELHEKSFKNGVLVIYGELYGDGIQKEVKYGEKNFAAFDMVWDGVVLNKVESRWYCLTGGIPVVPFIYYGKFEECLAIPNTFRSQLTPEECLADNFAEGVVIEPVVPSWFANGNRVYFKNKFERFSEKKQKKEKQPQQKVELSEKENHLLSEILLYNTPQRVDNVLSKYGNITNKDFGKILGLTIQDMIEEFSEDHDVDLKLDMGDEWKQVSKLVTNEVSGVVREQFLKIVE